MARTVMVKVDIQKKKCITPVFRASFPNIFTAKSYKDQKAKFSITQLYPKSTDLSPLKQAAHWACVETWGEDKSKWPKKLRSPFRDGDEKEDLDGYKGMIFVNASSLKAPGVVDAQLQPFLNEADFYAGCYARAELIAFTYNESGNVGVSFSLQNVQKVKDGEAFGGRRRAEDVFEAVETVEEDGLKANDDDSFSGW